MFAGFACLMPAQISCTSPELSVNLKYAIQLVPWTPIHPVAILAAPTPYTVVEDDELWLRRGFGLLDYQGKTALLMVDQLGQLELCMRQQIGSRASQLQ